MRWDRLFDDLESQLEASQAADLSAEVAERARREAALVRLVDRLRPAVGLELTVHVAGSGAVRGRLLDRGSDWLLLDEAGERQALVALAAVLTVAGVGSRTAVADSEGAVAKRLDLRWALRGLARSRTGVALVLVDGTQVTGTLDRVGADHLDLAEHGLGEARRAGAVRAVRLVPLAALGLARSR